MASKCLLNGVHAWLNKKGVWKMLIGKNNAMQVVFQDDDYKDLIANTTFTWTPQLPFTYDETAPCVKAGVSASTYNLQAYQKKVTINGSDDISNHNDAQLRAVDTDIITINTTTTGGTIAVAENPTCVGRFAKFKGIIPNDGGILPTALIYQTGDPDNNILIYDENIGDNTLSNLKASDISLASNGTYTVSNGSNASNEKYFYIYAYNQRNIDFNLLNGGSLTLIKTLTTYADDEVVDMNDLKNIISNTKDTSTSTGDATYVEITDSSYSISLPAKTLLYVKYTGDTGFKFSPVTYNENTGGGGSTPSGSSWTTVKLGDYVNVSSDNWDDDNYTLDNSGNTFIISTIGTESGIGDYDSINPVVFKFTHNNSTPVRIYTNFEFTDSDECVYIGLSSTAMAPYDSTMANEQYFTLTNVNEALYVKFAPNTNTSYSDAQPFSVEISAKAML